jgi:hypothetical protein
MRCSLHDGCHGLATHDRDFGKVDDLVVVFRGT